MTFSDRIDKDKLGKGLVEHLRDNYRVFLEGSKQDVENFLGDTARQMVEVIVSGRKNEPVWSTFLTTLKSLHNVEVMTNLNFVCSGIHNTLNVIEILLACGEVREAIGQ